MPYARSGDHPETMLKMFWLLSEKMSDGGATMDDLLEAYAEVKGNEPNERTIRRIIDRINLLFDPDVSAKPKTQRLITCREVNGARRYQLTQQSLAQGKGNPPLATQLLLSLYPHKPHMNRTHFEQLTKTIFQEVLRQEQERRALQRDMEKYVFVCGTQAASPEVVSRLTMTILDSIRRQKNVQLDYLSISGGDRQRRREIAPYGIVCRQDVWYLVGCLPGTNELRMFRCDHIQNLSVVENSINRIPDDFSLEEKYRYSWGVWTESEHVAPVLVRLKVEQRLANKFNTTMYHGSQRVAVLDSGEVEVSFQIAEPGEMLPWLMGWGDTVEVLEPAELRQDLCEMARGIANLYS